MPDADSLSAIHKRNLAPLRALCERADQSHRRAAFGLLPKRRGFLFHLTSIITRW